MSFGVRDAEEERKTMKSVKISFLAPVRRSRWNSVHLAAVGRRSTARGQVRYGTVSLWYLPPVCRGTAARYRCIALTSCLPGTFCRHGLLTKARPHLTVRSSATSRPTPAAFIPLSPSVPYPRTSSAASVVLVCIFRTSL